MEEEKKLSYEELEKYASQVSAQAQQMYKKLQEMNIANMLKRLDYLFKVLEYHRMFNSEFTNKCIAEIQEIMSVPEEEKEEDKE